MIINILLTVWITFYCLLVILDNTPCDNSMRKAFLFLSSFAVNTSVIAVIWHKELISLLGGQ
jgi:hypothetical protein